ncbi:hypothetical protein PM082_010596 [Marasmius tenuissimus]|nr:hypothetical protein PM082_010596 [Marasmius tenuissimus]
MQYSSSDVCAQSACARSLPFENEQVVSAAFLATTHLKQRTEDFLEVCNLQEYSPRKAEIGDDGIGAVEIRSGQA